MRLTMAGLVMLAMVLAFLVSAHAQGLDSGTAAVRIKDSLGERSTYSRTESWIEVSFVVQLDGSVGDILVEDSLGGDSARRAAVRNISKWRYVPATWRSLPVKEAINHAAYFTDLNGVGEGVRKSMVGDIEAARQLIAENEFDAARERLAPLQQRSDLSLHEFAYLSDLRGDLEIRQNRAHEAAFFLHRATSLGEDYLGTRPYYDALRARLVAEVGAYMYADALNTIDQIRTHKLYAYDDGTETLRRKLLELATNEQPYETAATIVDRTGRPDAFWDQQLLRRSIAFSEVEGTLTRLELRCQRHHLVDEPTIGKRWDLRPNWGACRIYVFGDVGSRFRLIQYPLEGEALVEGGDRL